MLTPELDAFITRMPKVELHLHLEGAVAPHTLLELAQRNNVEIPAHSVAGVEQLLRYRSLAEFIEVYIALAHVLIHGEDFEQVAYEQGLALAEQHVVYAEVMLSPMQHVLRGLDLREVVAGTAEGFARAQRETGVEVRLAMDYGRQYGPERAWGVLEMTKEIMSYGLVAWSIGGNEVGHPPEPFAEVFAAARAAGLRLMAHAGEAVGPPSVWGAVDALHVERLGHGIHSVHDAKLIDHLRNRAVALDVCPSSNLRTGAASSWEEHPIRWLYDNGVLVTVNSDDPTFFQTTLIDEYRKIVHYFGFNVDDLCVLVQNSVQASFLPPEQKALLGQQINHELQELRRELGV